MPAEESSSYPTQISRLLPIAYCLLYALVVVVVFERKIRHAPRPSEHPPVRGGEMSKRFGGIKG